MAMTKLQGSDRYRTTVDLPASLRERLQRALERGVAKSQNALIVEAIDQMLDSLERAWIDEQFAAMADDTSYNAQQVLMEREGAISSWEALQLGEAQYAKR